MAKRLEEFPVYLKAREFSMAVVAILERPAFGKNRHLRDQISRAAESVLANMAEGYAQSTDLALAKYLFTSKGSVAEVVTRLKGARQRGWISVEECEALAARGDEICRMLGGWIKYLARSDFKNRGRHRLRIED